MKNLKYTLPSFLIALGLFGLTLSTDLLGKFQRTFFSCSTPDGYYNGSLRGENYAIGAFTIKDDGTFRRCHKNPLLNLEPDSWESRHIKDPYAVKVGNEAWIYYAATDGLGQGYMIGLATTINGLDFTRHEQNPLLAGSFPIVLPGEPWKMFYSKQPKAGIWEASSLDGLSWEEKGLFLDINNRILIPGDFYDGKLYFGERRVDRGDYDVARYIELETGFVSELLLNLYPCSVTPRGVVDSSLMYPTIFSCEVGIKETVAKFEDGKITNLGLLGTPEPGEERWDAVSAENITFIHDY